MNLEAICHSQDSVSRLHVDHQSLIKDLANSIEPGFVNPYYCKQKLWTTMASKKIEIRPELFSAMEKDDSLEMWSTSPGDSAGLRFLFAMGSILTKTSYTLDQLTMIPWDQLFERDAVSAERIIGGVGTALATQTTQYDVTDWHTVRERQSLRHRVLQVRVKQMSPFVASNGTMGVFGLIKVRRPAS